jgi:hypothetical protein
MCDSSSLAPSVGDESTSADRLMDSNSGSFGCHQALSWAVYKFVENFCRETSCLPERLTLKWVALEVSRNARIGSGFGNGG